MMRISGRGDDGKAKAIGTDNQGNLKIKIVNSHIERVPLLPSLILEGTSSITTDTIDLSPFHKLTYIAINRTNVPVRVRPQVEDTFVSFFESGEFKSSSETGIIVPPSSGAKVILNDALPRVLDRPVGYMRFLVDAQETPLNNGTFMIYAWGVKN